LLERIPSTAPNKVHYEITKSLLAAGAKGRNLSVALVKATLRKDTETASMLIDYQASVNYNEAQALQIAVKSGNVNMLHVLLTGRPSKDSVNFAFPLIPRNDRAFKLSMTLLLLRNGASGHAVSTALVEAVSDRTEVHDIDLIETLLEHKADPNFRDGQALQIAARRANKEILSLILRYKPKIETVSQAVTATMDIRSANECCETLRILLQHGATGPTVSQALHVALERSPAFDNVAKLLLEHKANPNHAEGKAVLTAVTHCTPELLSAILATGLSKQGVRSKAFTAAFSSGTKEKVKKIEILLHAGISSTAISDGLIHEVELNQPNLSIVRLLIQHGADVNYQKGRVIQSATTSGNVALLSQLVANQVTKETLLHAIPLSMDLKLHKTRSDVLAVLLKTTQNVFTRSEIRVTDEFGAAVITEVERSDPSRSILEQLLEAGASASFNGGQAIQYATSNGNVEVLEMLVAKTASANMLGKAIPQASSFPSKSQRHKLMKLLLEAGAQGTPVDEALVKAVNDSDEVLVNLLLEHNASIDHNGGQCVLDAVKNGRGKVLDSLLRYLPSQATVDATFGLILEPLKNGKKDTGLLRIILQYHPSTPLISSFLEESIPGAVDVPGRYMVHLLLDAGASVDYHGGAALKHATRKGDIELLQKMLNMKPRAETVSNAFLEVFDCDGDQQSLLKMLDLFLTCHCPPALEAYARDQTNPLVLAL
jgi:ankyrin repeat protein